MLRLTYRASQIYLLLWMHMNMTFPPCGKKDIGTGLKSLTQFDERLLASSWDMRWICIYLYYVVYIYICMFLGLSGISTVDEFVPFPISTACYSCCGFPVISHSWHSIFHSQCILQNEWSAVSRLRQVRLQDTLHSVKLKTAGWKMDPDWSCISYWHWGYFALLC